MNKNTDLILKLNEVPNKPGVYLQKNQNNQIIYIGKAINLRKRLSNYFCGAKKNNSYKNLTEHIYDFDYIVSSSNSDALILEDKLIKKYNPPFNILQKDNKSYPYIVVTKETYPRLLYLRKYRKKISGKYFGPFPTGTKAKEIYNLLSRIFMYRKCTRIPKKKCLFYDLGQCHGPCQYKVDPKIYDQYTKDIKYFFKGKNSNIIKKIIEKRDKESKKYSYEKSLYYQNIINGINNISFKRTDVTFAKHHDVDVLSFYANKNFISVSLFLYRDKMLINKINKIEYLFGNINDVCELFLFNVYSKIKKGKYLLAESNLNLKTIANDFDIKLLSSKFYSNFLELVRNNSKIYMHSELNLLIKRKENINYSWKKIKSIANIKYLENIVIIDNSCLNQKKFISGINLYQNGYLMSNYSRFYYHDKNVTDDLDAIQKAIVKYLNQIELDINLIICDGGLLQINSVIKNIRNTKFKNIKVCGLVKNKYHMTEYLVIENKNYKIKENKILYLYLANIQNTIHNYVINKWRRSYHKQLVKYNFENIKNIGPKTKEKLVKRIITYNSKKSILSFTLNDWKKIASNNELGKKLYSFFANTKPKNF